MYGDLNAKSGPSTYNPDDRDGFGAKAAKSASAAKVSAGFAPTAKGRFDGGAGSIYATADPTKAKKKKPSSEPLDEKFSQWSKALGLGAVAGAKAAPVLKAADQAREAAEAAAEEAMAAKEAAEVRASEAVQKADWITSRAEERVQQAEAAAAAAEAEAEAERQQHAHTQSLLEEERQRLADLEAEMAELRRELKHGPRKASPGSSRTAKVVDRRPLRLRGQIDAEAEAKAAALEARKAKREEHWKQVEEARLAKEEAILAQQESERRAKLPASARAPSSRRSSSPSQQGSDALKALERLIPKKSIPKEARGQTPPRQKMAAAKEAFEAADEWTASVCAAQPSDEPAEAADARDDALAPAPTPVASDAVPRSVGKEARLKEAQPTGMSSCAHSPAESEDEGGTGGSPSLSLYEEGVEASRAPAAYVDEQTAGAEHKVSKLLPPSLDSRLGSLSDLHEPSAAEMAVAAVEAARHAVPAPKQLNHLFDRAPSELRIEASRRTLKLSDSFSALPYDDFLSKLSDAEKVPPSPAPRTASAMRSAFEIGPSSPMALVH